MSKNIWRCSENHCGWRGLETDILTALNPFEPGILHACPQCKSIGSTEMECEVAGCRSHASCGTPTTSGYLRCCGKHMIEFGVWK